MNKQCPPCEKQHTDCFAHSNGRCAILSKTDFREKDCPFYKTKKQCAEENMARLKRLDEQGLGYLREKYGGK